METLEQAAQEAKSMVHSKGIPQACAQQHSFSKSLENLVDSSVISGDVAHGHSGFVQESDSEPDMSQQILCMEKSLSEMKAMFRRNLNML